jgi:type VII secretion-associated serine protease mycosin
VTRRTGLRAAVVLTSVLGLSATVTLPAFAVNGLPEPAAGCPGTSGVAAPAGTPWAQQALSFASVWRLTRGAGVTVAVVDSGVDANPQFGDRIKGGPDLAPSPTAAAPDADCVGHGTSVASIIAAAPMTGVSFTGVAPAADILSVKITNSDTFPGQVAAQAIDDAVDDGAQVINLSLATVDTPALASAVRFAQASNVVVVAAAGNDNPDGATGPFYPAAYPGVLSVGAVGQDGSLASFSDTRTPVSVTAPGVDVTAAYPGVFPQAYNPASNGTSFATAFVSGVVALVRAAHPGLDQAQVVARITATADGPAGPGTGHGLVNPVQAVTAVLPAPATAAAAPAQSGVPAQSGASTGTASARVTIDRAAPSALGAGAIAIPITVGAGALAVLVVAAAVVIPAGRRRHWRPGASSRTLESTPGPPPGVRAS